MAKPEQSVKRPSTDDTAETSGLARDQRGLFARLGPAGILAMIAAVLPAIGGFVLLGSLNVVGPWLAGEGALARPAGMVLFVAAFALLSGLAILPTYAQAVLGGWAFGFWVGLPGSLLGILGGAMLGYEVGDRASGDRATSIINENKRWRAVRDALLGAGERPEFWHSLGIVTLVRLNSPFSLTNLVLASVKVPRSAYALGTALGLAPRTAVAVWMAKSIEGTINDDAIDATKKLWFVVASVMVFLLVVTVIGSIANRAIARVTRMEDAGATSE